MPRLPFLLLVMAALLGADTVSWTGDGFPPGLPVVEVVEGVEEAVMSRVSDEVAQTAPPGISFAEPADRSVARSAPEPPPPEPGHA